MKANFKLLESDAEISKRISKQIADSLNSAVMGAVPTISSRIKSLVRNAIVSSPEYISLLGGVLQGELGVPSSGERLSRILDIWLKSMKISRKPIRSVGSRISGGITVTMIRDDYGDVLGTAEASYTTSKGRNIPWLEWLLIAGDKTLVADYIFTEDISTGISRTGLGLMRQKNTGRWHVPREFAGTATNNFVTRALSRLEGEVIAIMQKEVAKRLK